MKENEMQYETDKSPSTWLIWDGEGDPPEGEWITILWKGYTKKSKQTISIPEIVEEYADILKKRYLAFIYELGETAIKNKKIIDHLEIRPGFSYWWMTLLNEKSNAYKSPEINDVLKLMALHLFEEESPPSKVMLVSRNKVLKKTLLLWFKRKGIPFKWERPEDKNHILTKKYLRTLLPHPVKAITSLIYFIFTRWPLKRNTPSILKDTKATITFCSYFDNIDSTSAEKGVFYSYYWTLLPISLTEQKLRSNWIHIYIKDRVNPTAVNARERIDAFNKNQEFQFHTALESAITLSLIIAVLHDYIAIFLKGLTLITIKNYFIEKNSRIDFWHLFKYNWYSSICGSTAISNLIFLNLFENILKFLPEQLLGFYLMENQGWEMAMIYAWKRHGHKTLIGVPHSTIRYWDLRYFFDQRVYIQKSKNSMPLPDRIAVNGPVTMKILTDGGCPEDLLIMVEALRYLYLFSTPSVEKRPTVSYKKILVVTDYSPEITEKQISWLVEVASKVHDIRFTIKPHPNCPVGNNILLNNMEISYESIEKLLKECDGVFTSNTTSAAVDAYCAGLPVISMLDGKSLNMSPLRGIKGINFVRTPDELYEALLNLQQAKLEKTEKFFVINPEIPLWKELISRYTDGTCE